MATCALNSITLLTSNIGMDFVDILMLIIFFGGLIFASRDFRIGLILWEVLYSLLFLWMYNANVYHSCTAYSWVKPLVACIVIFALLALTLLPTKESTQTTGGYV